MMRKMPWVTSKRTMTHLRLVGRMAGRGSDCIGGHSYDTR